MFGQIHANGSRTARAHLPSLAKSTLVPYLVFGHSTLFMFVRCYLIYLCIILGINFISIFLIIIIFLLFILLLLLLLLNYSSVERERNTSTAFSAGRKRRLKRLRQVDSRYKIMSIV